MAIKTANVLARVEPEVKAQAEAILASLGLSASTTINLLYKQIILTRSIPFSIALPPAPPVRDELDDNAFQAMIQTGLEQEKAGQRATVEGILDKEYELLVEKEAMWAKMLEEVLMDHDIPCISVPVYGAGLTLKTGMQERLKVFVPSKNRREAEDLLNELYPADEDQ